MHADVNRWCKGMPVMPRLLHMPPRSEAARIVSGEIYTAMLTREENARQTW